MENKEIEAWVEGVIIGAWRDSWTKPEPIEVQRARQWHIYYIGFQDGMHGTVAGAISCLATNAFTKKDQTMFSYFSCDHGWFFMTKGGMAESPSPNVSLAPRYLWRECLIISAWRDSWVKPGKRVQAPEYQGWSQHRVDSICEG